VDTALGKAGASPVSSFSVSQPLREHPLWERAEQKRVPLSFEIELTARCNNDCRHCYINLPPADAAARARELSAAEIVDLAGQAVDLGALWCLLTGGEPLLRPDFSQIYGRLRRMGLLVSVFTNACLVTDEHVRLFRELPPKRLEITVYGVSEETYEGVTRVPGSYRLFRRGLERLQSGGVPVRLKAMALRSNLHEFCELAAFCREQTSGSFRWDSFLHLRYDRNEARNGEIRAERLNVGEVLRLESEDPDRLQALELLCAEEGCPGAPGEVRLLTCGAGLSSFTVTHDGRFCLCSALRRPAMTADLRAVSLAEAWGELVPQVRGERRRTGQTDRCANCQVFASCTSCAAHADLETGDPEALVAYSCELAWERGEACAERASSEV
jgi:radical SAM protein with 4Fe4S-binding SPASM domain